MNVLSLYVINICATKYAKYQHRLDSRSLLKSDECIPNLNYNVQCFFKISCISAYNNLTFSHFSGAFCFAKRHLVPVPSLDK